MKIGFYWLRTCDHADTWVIGEWNGDRFLLTGSDTGWFPEEMEEIGNLIEPPHETKDCAPETAASKGQTLE